MAVFNPTLEEIELYKVKPTSGEWTLLQFLRKSLDDTYEIFFQPFINGDNPDIAILRKGSGLLIIEVKDWNLDHYFYNNYTSFGLKKDNTLVLSPFKQAEKYKDNLFNLHSLELFEKKIANKKNMAVIQCAVYFHNANYKEIIDFCGLKSEFNYMGIMGKDSLNEPSFKRLLTKTWLNRESSFFGEDLYYNIKRYLKPPLHKKEEGINIIYTREQEKLLVSEIRPRRKIKGVAGSGKTLVLAKRAVNAYIRTGEIVLILTYNLALKNYIHDQISRVREDFGWDNFYITNYHQFFKDQANNYNLLVTNKNDWNRSDFFENQKSIIKKYKSVFIDEIQDYEQSWIDLIVKYFTDEETEFVVFGDEKQNIYDRELDDNKEPIVRTIPGIWNKSLNTSYRFSSNIADIARNFQSQIFKEKYNLDDLKIVPQLDFETRTIEYHFFNTFNINIIVDSIYNTLRRNEIHSSDVAILSSQIELLREIDSEIRINKKEKTTTTFEKKEFYEENISDQKMLSKARRLKKINFWMKTGTIKISTTHSFKGWEINTLFLLILNSDSGVKNETSELIYTALTRPRRNLFVYNLGNLSYDPFFKNEIQNYYYHP